MGKERKGKEGMSAREWKEGRKEGRKTRGREKTHILSKYLFFFSRHALALYADFLPQPIVAQHLDHSSFLFSRGQRVSEREMESEKGRKKSCGERGMNLKKEAPRTLAP